MTTATIEDTEITQLFGNPEEFSRRVMFYAEKTGARVSMVCPLRVGKLRDDHKGSGCF